MFNALTLVERAEDLLRKQHEIDLARLRAIVHENCGWCSHCRSQVKDADTLERDGYDADLTGWVARASANDLPVFTTHSSAGAFLPERER